MLFAKKMRLTALLASGLLLGGAAEAAPNDDMPSAMMEAAQTENYGDPTEALDVTEPTEGAPLGALVVNPSLRQIGLYKQIQHDTTYDGKTELLWQSWPELFLADGDGRSMLGSSNLQKLKGALEEYNYQERQTASRVRKQLREEALSELRERKKDGNDSYFHTYSAHSDIIVKRADAQALSFINTRDSFTNGAHGMYVFLGVNFDAETGKRLALTDVFMNLEVLPDNIIDSLREKYDVRTFFDSMEDTVKKSVLEETVSWTLGPRGVTFYFNPYEIGPYAAGLLSVTYLFDERPGLFREKYSRGSASYCEELPVWHETPISLQDDGSGKKDILCVGTSMEQIQIKLNDAAFQDERPAKDIAPVFVHTGDNRNYLYVDCASTESGDETRELRIYDLNGPVPSYCGLAHHSFLRSCKEDSKEKSRTWHWIMTDPYEFCIDEPFPSDKGISKTHVVEIGADGNPTFG